MAGRGVGPTYAREGAPVRRATIVAFAIMLATAPFSSLRADANTVDPARLRAEMRFRQELGFRADEAFVREMIAAMPVIEGPAALTPAEEAELNRRASMQEEMDALEKHAESLPAFAGHWIDQRAGGVITVAFNGGSQDRVADLQPLVPANAALKVIDVPHSLDELRALEEQIHEDLPVLKRQGIEVVHWGVDVSENRVKVGIVGLNDSVEKALRERYGDRFVLLPANPSTTGCTGRETCIGPPLRGGISGAPAGTSYRNRCSIAFLIHYGSATQWLTAGHCAQTEAAGRGCTNYPVWCWYQGANASWAIGRIFKTCWPGCLRSDSARAGNISSTYASYRVYLTPSSTGSITGSQYKDGDDEGDITCINARRVTSSVGYFCGTIDHIGRMTYGNVYFEDQRFATYDHMYGDSGGAVHSYSTNKTFLAYGVHSGCTNLGSDDVCYGLSVYSHIYWVLYELGGGSVCSTWDPCP